MSHTGRRGDRDPALRSARAVLGTGVVAGLIAGLAAGAIDALWSWGPAAQFVPGVLARARFVAFVAATYGGAGALAGLGLAAFLLALSRHSRLGDLLRFAWRAHEARRAGDPRDALAGLALVLAGLPCLAGALYGALAVTVPYVSGRKEWTLVTVVAMGAALAALGVALVATFLIGRRLEDVLRFVAGRAPRAGHVLASPYAPLVAGGALAAIALAAWAVLRWETARVLPLRGPAVAALGLALALPAWRHARRAVERLDALRPVARRAAWAALPPVALACVLATGGSTAVIKASEAYSGLGGSIARTLRKAFDWDGDGYARFLGGGDCDDGDPRVYPNAPEVPGDGIDQNCIGGDAVVVAPVPPVFAPVPAGVPPDFRVLFITIDTARADHFGAYGYARPTTPNLDALAADGTLFVHGWAHAPSTRYSIPAILTGRWPLDVAYDTSVDGWPGLSLDATTIGEVLAARGFTGGAITNYWYFDKSRNMDQGLVEYDNSNARLHGGVPGAGPEQTRGSSSKEQTDKALQFVERHADRRWFLWVHYYDPHYAYEPHPELPSFGGGRVDLYDGELRFTDHHVGRLLDGLRARGQYDKTVVVVTGDHGEGFGEHGIELHGYDLYAAQTKVPMIVRVPGVAPRRSTTPAGHVDLLPTLVNLAGGEPTAEMQGESLVDVIAGAPDRDRVVFQQLSYEGNHEHRGAASRDCHVLYNASPVTSWEVYRLDRDPREERDVSGDDAACADVRAQLARWYDRSQIAAGADQALLAARPAIARPLDVDLGAAVRLLDVDAPATVRPGQQLALAWTFEARGSVAPGWKMFVHVEGPGRMPNGDHRPARPFEWWRAGDFIRYTTTLTIPRHAPRGRYTVRAGMFRGATRARISAPPAVRHDHDAAVVATFEVAP